MARQLTYKAAGVDISQKERLIPVFRRLARPTLGAHVIDGIGGFGALIDPSKAPFRLSRANGAGSRVLVAGTDGVGTKLSIAFMTGRHDTIGVDCVAMCVNDIICHAARPLFFLDYIGSGKLDSRVTSAIVRGVARGCRESGMSLVGGETAQMPGIYKPDQYDLVGFAVGIAERRQIPSPAHIASGDILVGLASSGLHSNGFSLVRKVLFERAKLKIDAVIPDLERPLADELLRPTRIYAGIAAELFQKFKIKGLAHITGGGIIENLPRVIPPGMRSFIRRESWPIPPIFTIIQRLGRLATSEMDHTFNNGLGMIAIVPPRQAEEVVRHLRGRRQSAYIVGEIRRGQRGVSFV